MSKGREQERKMNKKERNNRNEKNMTQEGKGRK